MSQAQGSVKFDSFQAECCAPWLSEVLLNYADALQLCQQLKDKVSPIFQLLLNQDTPLVSNNSGLLTLEARAGPISFAPFTNLGSTK